MSKNRSQSKIEGQIKFEFTQYGRALEEESTHVQSQLMQGDLRAEVETSNTRSRLDLSGGKFLGLNSSYFAVQELYTDFELLDDHVSISLGRRLENWSSIDRDWQLGLWEPQYNAIDSLRPINQGLTGLFVKSEFNDFEVLAYASPIFIPTMNPEVYEKSGALSTESRWYKTPSTAGTIMKKNTRFVYRILNPDFKKLVANPGVGARLSYAGRAPGAFASINATRKPINSLFVKYDYDLAIRADGGYADIQVSPNVSYHRMMGADVGWIFEKGRLTLSALRDQPEQEVPLNEFDSAKGEASNWVQQQPGSVTLAALHADTDLAVSGFIDPIGLSFDYLRASEEITKDVDAKGKELGSLLPDRLKFTNAAAFRTKASTIVASRPLIASFRYLREFDQKGSVWSLMAQYFPRKNWVVHAGLDILGVDDDSENNTDRHFLNQFRANDRMFGGLSYVF